jgi:hypothetical protein
MLRLSGQCPSSSSDHCSKINAPVATTRVTIGGQYVVALQSKAFQNGYTTAVSMKYLVTPKNTQCFVSK